MGLFTLLFGQGGGLTQEHLARQCRRESFSDYLPYLAYDEDSQIYHNSDGTLGMIWECRPLNFAPQSAYTTLEGLFRAGFPEGSVFQFILHADPHVTPVLERHLKTKTRQNPLLNRIGENFTAFLHEGRLGLEQMSEIPLRQFRLFFAAKAPAGARDFRPREAALMLEENLFGARLYPRPLKPVELVGWLRRLLNDEPGANTDSYDERLPIRKQVILAETAIAKEFAQLRVGSQRLRCLTPKTFPTWVDALRTHRSFGGIEGVISDAEQITTPFLYCLNILLENQAKSLHTKCNFTLLQKDQKPNSFSMGLNRQKEEFFWATDELEKQKLFLRVVPAFWVIGRDEEQAACALTRARRLWEGQGYVMQEERGILPVLFVASLPFGLYHSGNNLAVIARDHIAQTEAISLISPIQGDFSGSGSPVLLFAGRKGQICGLDLFDAQANNHNALVSAGSGGGKSFFVNYLVGNYYATGAKIRIIDIGRSYQKATKMYGARFLAFSGADMPCLNPFTNVVDEVNDIPVIAPIIAQMAFSGTATRPSEIEMTLIKNAVRWAYEQQGPQAEINTVHAYLSEARLHGKEQGEIREAAERLAFNLAAFTSAGPYGRFFNGPSTFDISSDEFVVLELEELAGISELFRVVTLQVVNDVTKDLYLSDRTTPRFVIFDEAWRFLREASGIAQVIEEGYRRARKYGGSFTIITQSALDITRFGDAGEVIWANSAFRFFLESDDIAKAAERRLIDYDPFTLDLLKGVKSKKPRYTEIFMDTPCGVGVGRLVVDPFSYYAYTTTASEVAAIEALVTRGASYEEAIARMVESGGR